MSYLKRLYRSMVGLAFIMLFYLISVSGAMAEMQGTITVAVKTPEVTMHMYRIGSLDAGSGEWVYTPDKAFEQAGFTLSILSATADIQAAKALELQQYVIAKSVPAYQSRTADANGTLVFTGVSQGAYLLVKEAKTAGKIRIEPFFVTMPLGNVDGSGNRYEYTCEPKVSEAPEIVRMTIRKLSKDAGIALGGAKFELAYRQAGSSSVAWSVLASDLTTGRDGSVGIDLVEYHWNYEYRLIETQAPVGYSRARVGTIYFTVNQDGTIAAWSHTGTAGYVEISGDKTAIIARNHSTGGDSEETQPPPTTSPGTTTAPEPTAPTTPTDDTTGPPRPTLPYETDPERPGIVVPPGNVTIEDDDDNVVWEGHTPDGFIEIELDPGQYTITVIDDEGVPLAYMLDVPVPLSGLARTGDDGISVLSLVLMLMAALFGYLYIIWLKRRNH